MHWANERPYVGGSDFCGRYEADHERIGLPPLLPKGYPEDPGPGLPPPPVPDKEEATESRYRRFRPSRFRRYQHHEGCRR